MRMPSFWQREQVFLTKYYWVKVGKKISQLQPRIMNKVVQRFPRWTAIDTCIFLCRGLGICFLMGFRFIKDELEMFGVRMGLPIEEGAIMIWREAPTIRVLDFMVGGYDTGACYFVKSLSQAHDLCSFLCVCYMLKLTTKNV